MMCRMEEWDGGGGWGDGGDVIPGPGRTHSQSPLPPDSPQLVVCVALLVGTELGQDHLEDPHEDQQVDLAAGT